ncbi:DUF4136 domain-containing protein [Brachymonas sp. G13]|uniref:DUF4136 domain-containing protein n=1 Tax=Brachymonas wangyanguii TaxID=3130163 RepID=UPI00307DFC31
MTQSVHTDSHQTVAAARRPLTAIALAAGVALLAGCSTTFSTQVTNFNQWPQHTRGATYTIVQNPQPGTLELSELERQTYENQLSRALQAQGLVPAARPESARLEADMGVTLKREIIEYTRPVYRDMPWWGWPGYNFGPGFGPWDHWEDGGLGGAWGGMYLTEQLVRQPLHTYSLKVRIRDRAQQQGSAAAPAVFESTAQYAGNPVQLPSLMPYLMQSAFDGFPGQNGQTRKIEFDADTGARRLPTGQAAAPAAAASRP